MNFFQKQPMMRRVLYALTPIYVYSLFLFGIRIILLSIVIFISGILTEYIMEKRRNKKVSEAVLVTCMIYTLSLPPEVPWWIASIGIIFGVLFGKEVYGGFGRNVFNPAITGRLFIYITFPTYMTSGWIFPHFPYLNLDTTTSATPLAILREGNLNLISLKSLFFGIRSGSFGETAVFLITLSAIYLIVTKTASWRIMLSTFTSAFFLTFLLDIFNFSSSLPTLPAILSGSLIFVSVFIATDPITAPKNAKMHFVYGIIIGISTVVIRTFSLFSEGTSFAILLGNTFAPFLDELSKKRVNK
ncbi:MAG: RnfABCDGE type electron transport complex subunit D [Thermosipho sp. (in: Bacteria)]|nr:RnfABCDGE type electron transport complex subunit D [Thermosipho sp. (in: thermotogales)]